MANDFRYFFLLAIMMGTRFFITNSIFHFSLSCQGQNYDFCLAVAKKLLSVKFESNMISAWHLKLKAFFFQLSDFVCRRRIVRGTQFSKLQKEGRCSFCLQSLASPCRFSWEVAIRVLNKYVSHIYYCSTSVLCLLLAANIYLFKLNNKNTRKRCGICSKLTIKHQNDVIDICHS